MKIYLIALLLCVSLTSYCQIKILRSTYFEVNSQLKVDPEVSKIATSSINGAIKIFATMKNGYKYSFTFDANNYKLYAMTLSCNSESETNQKFISEKVKRRAIDIKNDGNFIFYDERDRGIYLWLSTDDFGRSLINWEAVWPFSFDL